MEQEVELKDEVEKLRNQVNTLRICNLITSVSIAVISVIYAVRCYQIYSRCDQIVELNCQILSNLEQYLLLLQRILETCL